MSGRFAHTASSSVTTLHTSRQPCPQRGKYCDASLRRYPPHSTIMQIVRLHEISPSCMAEVTLSATRVIGWSLASKDICAVCLARVSGTLNQGRGQHAACVPLDFISLHRVHCSLTVLTSDVIVAYTAISL